MEDKPLDAQTEEILMKWAPEVRLGAMESFSGHFGKRHEEIEEALGYGLETADPYLIGFARGMLSGLDFVQGMIEAQIERLSKEIPPPDGT